MQPLLSVMTVALVFSALPAAQAQTCSNNDFKGVYSATVVGSFITPPPGIPPGPTARVGRVQLDGNGVSSIVTTLSLDGTILSESYGGTYTISPDCTASVILLIPFPGSPTPVPFQFAGMLANAGRNMDLVLLNPQGTDVRIKLEKQRKTVCSSGDLNGDYSLNMSGVVISGVFLRPGLFSRVGKVTFDGVGTFSAAVHTSYNGLLLPETFSGTYKMNADCSFTTAFQAGQASSWFGVLADTASGANLIESGGGSVITGKLTTVY